MIKRLLFIFLSIFFTQISLSQSKILGGNCQKDFDVLLNNAITSHSTFQKLVTKPVVKLAYLIPKNRVAKSYAVANMQYASKQIQKFYQDQMELNGFGKKTFALEVDAKGDPIVHIVKSQTFDDTYFWSDIWGKSLSEASKLGIGIWNQGEVWVVINECHLMGQDGTISGGTALGGGFGSGDGGGVAMIGSNALALFSETNLISNKEYAGQKNADLGEYILVKDKSFAWFEGATYSSVTSSYIGALAHELGHAFGLPHDFRNDDNFYGNLMGNGLRGIRGNFYPKAYEQNFTRLSYADALIINRNHFFNQAVNQAVAPLEVSNLQIQGGLVKIDFKISNLNPLSSIHLQLNGDFVDEKVINGKEIVGSFLTPFLAENTANNYQLLVYDQQGNRSGTSKSITLTTVPDRMASPFIRVNPIQRLPQNLKVEYSASNSTEHQKKNLIYTWEQSDDRVNFREFSQNKIENIIDNFDKKFVRLKIKAEKDSVYSTSVFVVSSPFFDRDNDGVLDHLDQCLNSQLGVTVDSNGCTDSQKDTDKDGITDDVDDCPLIPNPSTPIISIKNYIELSVPNGTICKWYLNGKELANQTTSSIRATSSGNYTVMTFDSKGCKSKMSPFVTILITGNQWEATNFFKVYPNPFDQSIKIEFPKDFGRMVSAKIHDVKGVLVWEKESVRDSEILDLSSLSVGNYLFNLISQTTGQVVVVKINKHGR